MSLDAQLIPATVVYAIIFFDLTLRCLQGVMRSIEGRVEQEGLLLGGRFIQELESVISDGIRGVERAPVECFRNFPFFAVETKGVVTGEEVGRAGQMPPIALEAKIGWFFI